MVRIPVIDGQVQCSTQFLGTRPAASRELDICIKEFQPAWAFREPSGLSMGFEPVPEWRHGNRDHMVATVLYSLPWCTTWISWIHREHELDRHILGVSKQEIVMKSRFSSKLCTYYHPVWGSPQAEVSQRVCLNIRYCTIPCFRKCHALSMSIINCRS